ncbi:uncharacterized protein RJT20DRAFT_59038 [Scheffersomyces xylosifermentans]|uniref:uncharacterized protein n=1 Tax=Scheffersomyces xylosifermentans TaxID=1304137 RepID=UPI00315CB7EE
MKSDFGPEEPPPDEFDECTICLEPLLPSHQIGSIPSCCGTSNNKYYHDRCILQWAANSNSCPTCRKRFYSINIANKSTPHRVKRVVAIKDKLLPNDAINNIPRAYITPATRSVSASPHGGTNSELEDDDIRHAHSVTSNGVCTICSSSDYRSSIRNMIDCNFCGSNFHLNCLGISSGQANELLNWCCPICDNDQDLILPATAAATGRRAQGSRFIPSRTPVSRTTPLGRIGHMSTIRAASITDSVYRNPIGSLLSTNSASFAPTVISNMSNEPTLTTIRRRPGLIIHNENNELDDDFLYNNDNTDDFGDRMESLTNPIHESYSPVINGGVILRKELRAKQNLSPEEIQSWDLFEEARHEGQEGEGSSSEQILSSTAEEMPTTSLHSSGTSDLTISTSANPLIVDPESKKRRRRKKVTPVEMKQIVEESKSDMLTGTTGQSSDFSTKGSSSRISNLISQLKTSPPGASKSRTRPQHQAINSMTFQPPFSPPPQPFSNAESPVSMSPSGNSPMEVMSNDSDTQYDSDSKVRKKPKIAELTLDQKIEIQKYIRGNLRPLYKPNNTNEQIGSSSSSVNLLSPSPSPIITSEEKYININKVISRRIYGHILSESLENGELCTNLIDQYFNDEDPTKLRDVIDKYVREELEKLQTS